MDDLSYSSDFDSEGSNSDPIAYIQHSLKPSSRQKSTDKLRHTTIDVLQNERTELTKKVETLQSWIKSQNASRSHTPTSQQPQPMPRSLSTDKIGLGAVGGVHSRNVAGVIVSQKRRLQQLTAEKKKLERALRQVDRQSQDKGVDWNELDSDAVFGQTQAQLVYLTGQLQTAQENGVANKRRLAQLRNRCADLKQELKELQPQVVRQRREPKPRRIRKQPTMDLLTLHEQLSRRLRVLKSNDTALSAKVSNLELVIKKAERNSHFFIEKCRKQGAIFETQNELLVSEIKELATQSYGSGIDDVLQSLVGKLETATSSSNRTLRPSISLPQLPNKTGTAKPRNSSYAKF